jgi:hypothetical protein
VNNFSYQHPPKLVAEQTGSFDELTVRNVK